MREATLALDACLHVVAMVAPFDVAFATVSMLHILVERCRRAVWLPADGPADR